MKIRFEYAYCFFDTFVSNTSCGLHWDTVTAILLFDLAVPLAQVHDKELHHLKGKVPGNKGWGLSSTFLLIDSQILCEDFCV